MQLRITPAMLNELRDAIDDAFAPSTTVRADPTNATYQKIMQASEHSRSKRGFLVQVDSDDIAELKDRALYNVGEDGVCHENLRSVFDAQGRGYWLGRIKAYKALLGQIEQLESHTEAPQANRPRFN